MPRLGRGPAKKATKDHQPRPGLTGHQKLTDTALQTAAAAVDPETLPEARILSPFNLASDLKDRIHGYEANEGLILNIDGLPPVTFDSDFRLAPLLGQHPEQLEAFYRDMVIREAALAAQNQDLEKIGQSWLYERIQAQWAGYDRVLELQDKEDELQDARRQLELATAAPIVAPKLFKSRPDLERLAGGKNPEYGEWECQIRQKLKVESGSQIIRTN